MLRPYIRASKTASLTQNLINVALKHQTRRRTYIQDMCTLDELFQSTLRHINRGHMTGLFMRHHRGGVDVDHHIDINL